MNFSVLQLSTVYTYITLTLLHTLNLLHTTGQTVKRNILYEN